MAVIRSNLGWKVKDFRGMAFKEIKAKFTTKSVKKLKTSEEVTKEAKSPDEVLEEKVKEMMQLVPIEEVFATATVVTPYRRRNGKAIMVESETPNKKKVARDAEIARIHAEEELYKARLVANGSSQQFGVDCDDTFSHTIRTILSLALSRNWHIHQLDVKNAFFNGDLSNTMYMYQQPGSVDTRFPYHEFDMTDLGELNYFLGISVTHDSTCNFLSQNIYALKLLDRARSLVAYTDVDWAGCPTTRQFRSGYCVFLGDNLLSWSAKRQHTLSRSSAKAEYRGVATVVAETVWLRNLLRELHTLLFSATLVYCDNVSAIYMTANPVQRTNHIEINIHFVRDMVAHGEVCVFHVPSRYQSAYLFTKGLPSALFEEFRTSLSVRPSPAQTAEAY
nr:ribonuclease H-like domain-containing protein [Tanacetum cinerariifolium]